jgi:hypothetical protein
MAKVVFSCVVDNQPKFILQSLLWATTILKTQNVQKEDIVFHVIKDIDARFLKYLNEKGYRYIEVPKFGDGHAVYCNKLQQLTSNFEKNYDFIVLSDTDIAYVDNIQDKN